MTTNRAGKYVGAYGLTDISTACVITLTAWERDRSSTLRVSLRFMSKRVQINDCCVYWELEIVSVLPYETWFNIVTLDLPNICILVLWLWAWHNVRWATLCEQRMIWASRVHILPSLWAFSSASLVVWVSCCSQLWNLMVVGCTPNVRTKCCTLLFWLTSSSVYADVNLALLRPVLSSRLIDGTSLCNRPALHRLCKRGYVA